MSRWLKASLGVLVVGILALGSLGGYALAQGGTEEQAGQSPQEQFLGGVADKLGVSVDELKEAVQSTELEMLDEAVAAGKIGPEVGDRLRQRIDEGRFLARLRASLGAQAHLNIGPRVVLNAAADILDMTPRDLVKEMRTTGKSLAGVAEEKGVSRDDLKDGIIANVEEYFDRGLERLRANIDSIIDRTPGQPAGPSAQ